MYHNISFPSAADKAVWLTDFVEAKKKFGEQKEVVFDQCPSGV